MPTPESDLPRTTVVLFSRAYPFGVGEPFLEAELAHLSRAFDHVIIAPVGADPSTGGAREVPPGTIVAPRSRVTPVWASLRFAARRPLRFSKLLINTMREDARLSDRFTGFRFALRAETRSSELIRELERHVPEGSSVVLYSYWLDLPAAVAAKVRSALGFSKTTLVSRAHRFDIYGSGPDGYLPQRESVLREVDKIYAVSEAGATYLRERWPAHAAKVSVARLGAPQATETGIASNAAPIVRSCSRVVPFKRLPLLIESLALAQQTGVQVQWEHIGGLDGPYAEYVLEKANSSLAPGSFTFAGRMSNSAVRDWHASSPAAVFANVSESEGVPVSILEALAHGLPIVATDVGGSAETIDSAAGMFDGLVPSDADPSVIAEKLLEILLADEGTFRRYSAASVEHWAGTWSSESNFKAFADLLKLEARPTV